MRRRMLAAAAITAAVTFAPIAASAAPPANTEVSVGSPSYPFSQNKQNEPGIAVNPLDGGLVAAGSNDEIDMEGCLAGADSSCPFTRGVGVSGIYFSRDGGKNWVQPTYKGWTARDCLGEAGNDNPCQPHVGDIGTLPNYYENGLVSNGDPTLVFGPQRDAHGHFSWDNGWRLYYGNIATPFTPGNPHQQRFAGASAITVSYLDEAQLQAALDGENSAWSDPVVVTKQNAALFSDKEEMWADNAASSRFFGNVYMCNVGFRGNGGAEPVLFATSRDGGTTWRTSQISAATNTNQTGGRQGCFVRTDSQGTVYVFWAGYDKQANTGVFYEARSFDGGFRFERPRAVVPVGPVGQLDPVTGRSTIDGVAGARTDAFPKVDIANGAPSGAGATNTIAMTWGARPAGTQPGATSEKAWLSVSTDQGRTFGTPTAISAAGDRATQASVALAPDGHDWYVVYEAFTKPWQQTTEDPRPEQGVVVHGTIAGGAVGSYGEVYRGAAGDARGSSTNSLAAEFLGDYTGASYESGTAALLWTDSHNAAHCPAVDAWRQALASGVTPTPARPVPCQIDPKTTFGNTDIGGFFAGS